MRKTSKARILIVEDVELEAKLLMRALADAGYSNLVHRSDYDSAVAEIEARAPRLVITDLRLGDLTGADLTRHIRKLEKAYTYVVMLTSSGSDSVLSECFEAGVDDFIEKPFRPQEITSRLRAGERIIELDANLRAKSRELETALRRIDVTAAIRALARATETVAAENDAATDASPLSAFVKTDSWRGVELLLTTATAEFLQLPFAPAPTRDDRSDTFVAEVSLSEPARQLELGLSVVVDAASMKRFAMHLLGEDDADGAEALMLETANILMGSLKTAFTTHGFAFTGGIPASAGFQQTREAFDKAPVRLRMAMSATGPELELWLRIVEKRNRVVHGRALKEGLVIGEDIFDPKGMLLIRGGSRLTETSAKRIAKLMPDLAISVSDPNA